MPSIPPVLSRITAKTVAGVAAALLLVSAGTVCRADEGARAAAPDAPAPFAALAPSAVFTQFGTADEVNAFTAGAMWNLRGDPTKSPWSVYLEASASRWSTRDGHPAEHGVLAQFAAIPVLRYHFDDGGSPWFVEGGIGATVTSSVYRSGQKRFSTAFNFGDHLGVGYAFGTTRRHEIVLRTEHFSNAGIEHPNPGQNFLQLRYAYHFR
jgi:lipid A 3-O-deacylase